ncbi:MAG: bifunctional phosphoribosyl-AMP cyclohydrolase/phosphoribosyl-ATP diphosphatase HisIE [Bacteroidales bacterium]|nr:bifunctional phosphoribosyl-AMP cyclohydrolase/phosphoribosyl-ATP diphosphatase HisIE [Bacteroidales bacterium]
MTMDFEKQNGLVPAIIQHTKSLKVLMLGYMNEEALEKTRESGKVTFYSRSKKRLWTKGESSGNFLFVDEIKTDCDSDALLVKVNPAGNTCHLERYSCFGEEKEKDISFLVDLEKVIRERKQNMPEGSYTTKLFQKGVNKIAQKVGEEATELIIEAKDNNDELFLNEAADLVYHLQVLLTQKGFSLQDVGDVLESRHSDDKEVKRNKKL